jgi:bacteriocin biosynthesis cyclodehydratase domain-containing protein
MRPAIRPGLQPIWRNDDTVQLGVDPRRAVAITGMSRAADVIRLLDGSRDREQVIAEARRCAVPVEVTERVLTVLAAAGALIDYPARLLRSLPPELRRGLLPVLAVASMSSQDCDGGAGVLARRTATAIEVSGCGPIAATTTDLLIRSGLAVHSEESGAHGAADLTVLIGRPQPEHAAELHRMRRPHLVVSAAEAIGIVGPLVEPGRTACLHCLDTARAEHDPAWPLLLAQVASRGADPLGCDPILATAVAAQAAAVVVAMADRAPLAAAARNGTLELVLPAWQWRRRSWLPHAACSCGSNAA